MSTPSKILPNSYQAPNFLVDDLMRYLTGNEHKCVDVVCRKTFGWQKRSDRISKSQLMELTGLGEDGIDQCMGELVKYGVVIRVSESVANLGVEWAMQLDDASINLSGLQERDLQRREANRKKMAAALAKRKGGVVEPTHQVEPPVRGVVEPPTQKPVKAIESLVVVINAGDVFKTYESEIGALTAAIRDKINGWIDKDRVPLEWLVDAMHIAAANNKRSWSYCEGCLNNWLANGRGAPKPGTGNGQKPQAKKLIKKRSDVPADAQAIIRKVAQNATRA